MRLGIYISIFILKKFKCNFILGDFLLDEIYSAFLNVRGENK